MLLLPLLGQGRDLDEVICWTVLLQQKVKNTIMPQVRSNFSIRRFFSKPTGYGIRRLKQVACQLLGEGSHSREKKEEACVSQCLVGPMYKWRVQQTPPLDRNGSLPRSAGIGNIKPAEDTPRSEVELERLPSFSKAHVPSFPPFPCMCSGFLLLCRASGRFPAPLHRQA